MFLLRQHLFPNMSKFTVLNQHYYDAYCKAQESHYLQNIVTLALVRTACIATPCQCSIDLQIVIWYQSFSKHFKGIHSLILITRGGYEKMFQHNKSSGEDTTVSYIVESLQFVHESCFLIFSTKCLPSEPIYLHVQDVQFSAPMIMTQALQSLCVCLHPLHDVCCS